MRVLFMNRPDWDQNPGGDTVVTKEYMRILAGMGIETVFSCDPDTDMVRFDIIHIINLTMTGSTEKLAQSASRQRKPFVVTTLQEDFPKFRSKVHFAANRLTAYVKSGQNPETLKFFSEAIHHVPQSTHLTSPFAALSANRLLACGEHEASLLHRMFPRSSVSVVKFGIAKRIHTNISKDLFTSAFNVKDFVLCVGSVEPRKNQLMLLTALEHDNIPIVFVDGTTTYSPSYKNACMEFKRSSKTIFTGTLSNEMLVSAYMSAKVHCLPSFYELPGLVSLEAARYGCKVTASLWGTLPDYLGNTIRYFEPDDSNDLRSSLLDTIESAPHNELLSLATSFTWEKSAADVLSIYMEILDNPYVPHLPLSDYDLVFDPLSLVEIILKNVECGNYADAISIYNTFRSGYVTDSHLAQIDLLIDKLVSTADCM
jgi:glycosyltransferase involved in cell wall biosynthesis